MSPQINLNEFISENDEIINRIGMTLHNISSQRFTKDDITQLYRDLHTLKGTALLFGFHQVGNLAHALESCFDPLRVNHIHVKREFYEVFDGALKLVEEIFQAIKEKGSDSDFSEKVNQMIAKIVDKALLQYGVDLILKSSEVYILDELNPHKNKVNKENHSSSASGIKMHDESSSGKSTSTRSTVSPSVNNVLSSTQTASAPQPLESKADHHQPTQGVSASESTIRVQVGLLDQIMNLVGELVLVRNGVLRYKNKDSSLEYANLANSLDEIASSLQNEVMKTRMQPIGTVVSKFQRLVREIANELNKKIDLTLVGVETEIDKTLLEAVKDPLTHIVRNSCDHGIESGSDRVKAGKPENGHVLIKSYHEGGQVVIEVSDDGRGMDQNRILAKAIEKKIITNEQAANLTEKEILNLIFEPGFSTAEKVTNVSGRGVGMDVVRTNIEKIGGSVVLMSQLGKGSTVKLVIPLTLAILQVLIVRIQDEYFCIPQVKISELAMVANSGTSEGIFYMQNKPMMKLRGEVLPLISLTEAIKLEEVGQKSAYSNIVVINVDGEFFGLIVDEIVETSEIVVKPLNNLLKKDVFFSGATLLGDGRVSLIIDAQLLAAKYRIKTSGAKPNGVDKINYVHEIVNYDSQEFLLFSLGEGTECIIPLCLVHRLEEFDTSQIEYSGDLKIIRYRNSIMPIFDLSEILGFESQLTKKTKISVFVMEKKNRYYGFAVTDTKDVIFIESLIDENVRDRNGIIGNVIYNNKVYLVVDALNLLSEELNKIGGQKGENHSETDFNQNRIAKILIVEDVSFFRKQIGKVLENAGYQVVAATDGVQAIDYLNKAPKGEVDLILSDIEMPNMNGLELAKNLKSDENLKNIPLVALTTKASQHDIQAGYAAGFNDYLEKLNSEKLLNSIDKQLNAKDSHD